MMWAPFAKKPPRTSPARLSISAGQVALLWLCVPGCVLVSAPVVVISELADPDNLKVLGKARYVELYNFGPAAVDLGAEGWALQRYTNGLTVPQPPVPLNGLLPPRGYFVACASATDFLVTYSTTCDQELGLHGPAHSNGDDQIVLLGAGGAVLDIFGVIGQDGTGTPHNFQSGRAERKEWVTAGQQEWVRSQWSVRYADEDGVGALNAPADYDPRYWVGADCCPEPEPEPEVAVDCVSSWGDWGPCSVTCGGGIQNRTFTVSVQCANGGSSCHSINGTVEMLDCNSVGCPEPEPEPEPEPPPYWPRGIWFPEKVCDRSIPRVESTIVGALGLAGREECFLKCCRHQPTHAVNDHPDHQCVSWFAGKFNPDNCMCTGSDQLLPMNPAYMYTSDSMICPDEVPEPEPLPAPEPEPPCEFSDIGVDGTPCVFPFLFEGQFYAECIIGQPREPSWNRYWCATAVDGDGAYIPGSWTECHCEDPGMNLTVTPHISPLEDLPPNATSLASFLLSGSQYDRWLVVGEAGPFGREMMPRHPRGLAYPARVGLVDPFVGLRIVPRDAALCPPPPPPRPTPVAQDLRFGAGANPGCTAADATNFDHLATVDDGTCERAIAGCSYPDALNFNLRANVEDGSCFTDHCLPHGEDCGPFRVCIKTGPGEHACPCRPKFLELNSSCVPEVPGCNDSTAWNFVAAANVDDGSCFHALDSFAAVGAVAKALLQVSSALPIV
jgi:hypothetical protein